VNPPDGWTVSTSTARFIQTGAAIDVGLVTYPDQGSFAKLTKLLSSDLVLEVRLRKR
jgi:hypothetical protein